MRVKISKAFPFLPSASSDRFARNTVVMETELLLSNQCVQIVVGGTTRFWDILFCRLF